MKTIFFCSITFVFSLVLMNSCNSSSNNTSENSVPEIDTLNQKDSASIIPKEEIPQTVDERINDIKTWYNQIQKTGKKQCKTKTNIRYDGLNPEEGKMPFDQEASLCKISDELELVQATLNGYEWTSEVSIYKRDGKIFFVLINGAAEGWSYERRYYCDKDENVIRFLAREADGGEDISGPQIEQKLDSKKPGIREYISEDLSDIETILKSSI